MSTIPPMPAEMAAAMNTTVIFPTIEAALSALCEKVLGAPCVIEPPATFTETITVQDLQHREFPPVTFCCSGEATREIIDVLRIAERSVNTAIREGADEVKLSYHNVLDKDTNPEGRVGTILTRGYRTGGTP